MNGKINAKRKIKALLLRALCTVSAAFTCALVLFLLVYILAKGIPNISWELLSTKPSYLSGKIGILPDILNTVYIIVATLVFVLPLSVGAAVYLTEYAKNKRIVAIIEYAAETLSGIPSIIYGLVGMLFFCQFLHMQTSLLAGALTLGEETPSLSGGEAQRLKLASEMGKGQFDTVFVFDEPTIGLHPLDVKVLLSVFQRLIKNGATVIVIEHDLDVIQNADYIIDMGPGGGQLGGQVVAAGTPKEICDNKNSVTGMYLNSYINRQSH